MTSRTKKPVLHVIADGRHGANGGAQGHRWKVGPLPFSISTWAKHFPLTHWLSEKAPSSKIKKPKKKSKLWNFLFEAPPKNWNHLQSFESRDVEASRSESGSHSGLGCPELGELPVIQNKESRIDWIEISRDFCRFRKISRSAYHSSFFCFGNFFFLSWRLGMRRLRSEVEFLEDEAWGRYS